MDDRVQRFVEGIPGESRCGNEEVGRNESALARTCVAVHVLQSGGQAQVLTLYGLHQSGEPSIEDLTGRSLVVAPAGREAVDAVGVIALEGLVLVSRGP